VCLIERRAVRTGASATPRASADGERRVECTSLVRGNVGIEGVERTCNWSYRYLIDPLLRGETDVDAYRSVP
jgi:hypothetical protein